jgi:hypothetical protein
MMLLLFLDDIKSERELMRIIPPIGAKIGLKKSSRFHLTGIPIHFRIVRAKCIAHISTRWVIAMHIGLSFGRAGAKSVLLY